MPDTFMDGITKLARKILLEIPSLIVRLNEENNPQSLFFKGYLQTSPLWEEIVIFFQNALRGLPKESNGTSSGDSLSPSNLAALFELLGEIVIRVPPLVNR